MTHDSTIALALAWYAALTLLAWAVYPALYFAARALPDRGLSLARPVGLLVAVLPSWWLAAAGLAPFGNGVIVAGALAAGVPLWALGLWRSSLAAELRARWRALSVWEIATVGLFLGYVAFRGFNPAIAFTEKPMDFAFLNSAIHATRMPPPDPWYAGEPINYYYLGYVLMAAVARLSRVPATVGFNLALATLFATATVAAAGAAANVARALAPASQRRAIAAGALGALLLVGIGNLVTPLRFLSDPSGTLAAPWWQGVGWQASRVIVDHGVGGSPTPRPTINEFPAFSFVLGDLHPHVLALPLFLSSISLAFALSRAMRSRSTPSAWLPPALLAGLLVGALYAANSWDAPTALALTLGGAALSMGTIGRTRLLAASAALAAAAVATAAPFALRYAPSVGGNPEDIPPALLQIPVVRLIARTIGIVAWERSSLAELLKVHGVFCLALVALLAVLWRRVPPSERWSTPGVALFAAGVALVALALHFAALVLFGVPLVLLSWVVARAQVPPPLRFVAFLFWLACLLVLVVEIVFLQDAFGDRMNTVFKVYFQVWSILAVATAVAVPYLVALTRGRLGARVATPVGVVAALLLALAAIYPPLSAYRWDDGFRRWQGLDGLGYLAQSAPDEARAIDWLARRASVHDVVLEAPGCSYGVAEGIPHDRVSMATGVPTVIGWNFHEYQWRSGQPELLEAIAPRAEDVSAIFRDPTSAPARALLDRYGVTYVFVGRLERDGYGGTCNLGPPYPAASLASFEGLGWDRAFASGDVVIYHRPASASAGPPLIDPKSRAMLR